MCGNKMAVQADEPNTTKKHSNSRSARATTSSAPYSSSRSQSQRPDPTHSSTTTTTASTYTYDGGTGTGSSYRLNSSTATAEASVSTRTSLSSFRNSLPENTHIYDFSEIRSATNNFLSKRFSSSSTPSWRCVLRGKDVVVFQRKFRRPIQDSELREKLSVIYRSHHMSIIKLTGASISGDYIYLAYDYTSGGNLTDCLRNKRNPEFTFRGLATQKSDVYAFGVVILELLSGEEPVKYRYDKVNGEHVKTLVVETARSAVGGDGGDEAEIEGRLRRWVDRRLKDSFPVVVAEKLTRIALDCVVDDPNLRPSMSRVAGKISKLYLDSLKWADTIRIPTDFTASFAPR
ncbi:putative protein kinase RLK-Pelle-LysM family [Helianthus annuus]|nr:putative protein kinase RLK-Pelle-LysM family [Helianthus annuus]